MNEESTKPSVERSERSKTSKIRRSISNIRNRSKKNHELLLPLPNYPEARHSEVPSMFEGEVQMKKCKRRRINRGKRYYAELNKGILKLYKDRMARESDGVALSHEFKIDLAKVPILYDDQNRRLMLLFKMESHSLAPVPNSEEAYQNWKDSIMKHRLHRQEENKSPVPKETQEAPKGFGEDDKEEKKTDQKSDHSNGLEGLDAVTRVMDECQNMHCMSVELLDKTTKNLEAARAMMADVKTVQKEMKVMLTIMIGMRSKSSSNSGREKRKDAKKKKISKQDSRDSQGTLSECSLEERKGARSSDEWKDAKQFHSDESDESDDETEKMRRTMDGSSLASLGAAMNVEKKKSEVLQRSKRALGKRADKDMEQMTQREEEQKSGKKEKEKEQKSGEKEKEQKSGDKEKEQKSGDKEKEQKSGDKEKEQRSGDKEKEQKSGDKEKEEKHQSATVKKSATVMCKMDEEKTSVKKSMMARRSTLPAQQIPGEAVGIKTFAAMAMTRSGLPISMYEPMTTLQTLCEELRFTSLLNKAVNTTDSVERLFLVTAFAVSGYNCTAGRARKPFNPILGETFDYAEDGWRYHAEQVSHAPQISAAHAEGKGWTWWQTFEMKSSISTWKATVEASCEHLVRLRIGKEEYAWNKVKTTIHNCTAVPEERSIVHTGVMHVSSSTGYRAKIQFKEKREIDGVVVMNDANQCLMGKLVGTWDRAVAKVRPNGEKEILFNSGEQPTARNSKYYGFTIFSCGLNDLSLENRSLLPLSDTRLRPDIRCLENGEGPRAAQFKEMLEQKQRERGHVPQYFFQPCKDSFTNQAGFASNGRYWKEKERAFHTQHNKIFDGFQ